MKYLKYRHCTKVNRGTPTDPVYEDILGVKILGYSEANEEIAKREAWGGEYTVEDDGQPKAPQTQEQRIAELEEALSLLLSGVTE